MAVPITTMHVHRVFDQITQNLIGIQRDINHNAQAHLAMAQAQNPSLPILQGFIQDTIAAYQTRLQWVQGRVQNVNQRAAIDGYLTKISWAETDLTDVMNYLVNAIQQFKNKSFADYASITTACQALINAVGAPDSLWPE